ncbi:MAG: copper resistance protein CopC [bacterium]
MPMTKARRGKTQLTTNEIDGRLARRLWAIAAVMVTAILLVNPAIAWAHARLTKSFPAANTVVTESPSAIRLWFSETPELSLTRITLTDSSGVVTDVGAPVQDVDGKLSVRIPISVTLHGGLYTVAWKTAATDGHPSSGKFSFRMNEQTATPAPTISSIPHSVPDVTVLDSTVIVIAPAAIVARTVSYAALIALIGAICFCLLVLPRVLGMDAALMRDIESRVVSKALIAVGVYLAAAAARYYVQNRMMMDQGVTAAAMSATRWTAMWQLQLGAGIAAGIGLVLVRRRIAGGWLIAAAACVLLAVATSLSGHAGAADRFYILGVGDDAFHIVAASGWLGSLLWLAFAGLPLVHMSGEGRGVRVAALVNAFSPVALTCSALVVTSGVVSATLRLGSFSAIWVSPYGQMLWRKLIFVLAVIIVGAWNWRKARPALGTDDASARFRRSARVELAFALIVIAATALLVAMPTPDAAPGGGAVGAIIRFHS